MKIHIKEVAKKNKGWSMYRLAVEMGLPQQTIYSWANGRTQPSYDNMDRLCGALDCKIGDIFETEPKNPGYPPEMDAIETTILKNIRSGIEYRPGYFVEKMNITSLESVRYLRRLARRGHLTENKHKFKLAEVPF